MNLTTRMGRLENAAKGDERVFHLIASDEDNLHRKFENLLLTATAGPAILDIDLAGVRSRQQHTFLTHEEALELLQ